MHSNDLELRRMREAFDREPELREKLIFLGIGLVSFLSVQLVGYITIAELVIAAALPFLVIRKFPLLRGWIRGLLFVGFLWLLGAVVSDLYRGSLPAQYLRGWFKVVMFLATITFFYLHFRERPRLVVWFLIGAVPSALLSLFVLRSGVTEIRETYLGETLTWANAFSLPFSIGLFALSAYFYRSMPRTVIAVTFFAGIMAIFLGSRSAGGVLIMAAVTEMVFFKRVFSPNPRRRDRALNFRRALLVAPALIFAGWLTLEGYSWAAREGVLGEDARQKYVMQAEETQMGLLLGGRVAFLAGLLAIKESPIVGYGSWAPDNHGFHAMALQMVQRDPSTVRTQASDSVARIPAHSQVLEAWVENGIFGGLFWILFLVLLAKFSLRDLLFVPALHGLMCILLWSLLWNIFFSPLGNRPFNGALTAIVIAIYDSRSELIARLADHGLRARKAMRRQRLSGRVPLPGAQPATRGA